MIINFLMEEVFSSQNVHDVLKKAIPILYMITIGELLRRCVIAAKEFICYKSHYSLKRNRTWTILKFSFHFNMPAIIFLSSTTLLLAATYEWTVQKNKFISYYLPIIPLYIIQGLINFSYSRISDAEWIRSGVGIDYATGMASNYFHGYLYLNLPHKGDGVKGIRERIEDYESKHPYEEFEIEFPLKRLVILVPDSMHIKPEIRSNILEKVAPLEKVMRDRAGVNRPFQNDVYRFTEKINGKNYYIVLEGATPVLSFYESKQFDITSTPNMKDMEREILFQFYKSLKKFTYECQDIRDECEIVYFPDYNEIDVGVYLKGYLQNRCNL